MITHTVTYYEAEDGQIFPDYDACAEHELNYLYHKSGVKCYRCDEKMETLDSDCSYDEMTDIFIDRTKGVENLKFADFIHYQLGWSLLEDAILGKGTHYQFIDSAFESAIVERK